MLQFLCSDYRITPLFESLLGRKLLHTDLSTKYSICSFDTNYSDGSFLRIEDPHEVGEYNVQWFTTNAFGKARPLKYTACPIRNAVAVRSIGSNTCYVICQDTTEWRLEVWDE